MLNPYARRNQELRKLIRNERDQVLRAAHVKARPHCAARGVVGPALGLAKAARDLLQESRQPDAHFFRLIAGNLRGDLAGRVLDLIVVGPDDGLQLVEPFVGALLP